MSLHDLTALEQAAAIRAGEVSAVELVEHYLRRAESVPGAYVVLTADLAIEQARAADEAVASGEAHGDLFGVVCPVKDLNFMVGANARMGSAVFDLTSYEDDYVVKAMRDAGLVFTGKTTTPEFGLPCYTEPEPEVSPPARCVWDQRRTAGGSSGGAAVAVAAGLAPIAHGSDGGGSIRIPASANGLVGIKPSRGRVSNGPIRDPIGDLVTSGPLARTVADAAALLDAMAVEFPGDPFHAPPSERGFLAAARSTIPRLRIGVVTEPIIADVELDPEAAVAVHNTAAWLEALGHEVVPTSRPFGPDLVAQFEAVWHTLALLTPVMPDDEDRLQPLTRHLRGLGREVSGIQLAMAVSLLRIQTRATLAAWSGFDAVVMPTVNGVAPLVDDIVDRVDPARDFENQKRWAAFTAAFNMTGQPAVSVPLHWTSQGLPVGVMLVGKMFAEETLIGLAAQLEQVHPWSDRKPEAW
ncbi:MAG TPA: amidase [Candidatus Nanopelagicales bacterium]|nr:amidase [Candidatus Nanopelagicales bacterium]